MNWLKAYWTQSISRQLILGIALVHAILMSIFVVDLVSRERTFLVEQNKALAIGLAETLAINGSSWLISEDLIGLEEVVNSQKSFPNLNYAMFINKNYKVLAFSDPSKVGLYLDDDISKTLIDAEIHTQVLIDNSVNIDIAAPIFSNKVFVGWARVNISRSAINENLSIVTNHGALYSIVAIIIGVIFAWVMAKGLTLSIRHLVDVSKAVERGQRNVSFQLNRVDELGILSDSLNKTIEVLSKQEIELKEYHFHLEQLVENRTQELNNANHKILTNNQQISQDKIRLEEAYNELIEFKDKLVEQEKFSQLGKLVADMAHELNTPLSIAITSGSVISDTTETLIKNINSIGLKKKELLTALESISSAQQLADKNLVRCDNLINDFKKISANQTIEKMQSVQIKDYLEELFSSFSILLQKKQVQWQIKGENALITLVPDHVFQIFNQLINNTMTHAFAENSENNILIEIAVQENDVVISYIDNGLGMSEKVLTQLFDPFFTTKRSTGYTGLGMSIVYSIVTQNLKGKIYAESHMEQGTKIVMVLPIHSLISSSVNSAVISDVIG